MEHNRQHLQVFRHHFLLNVALLSLFLLVGVTGTSVSEPSPRKPAAEQEAQNNVTVQKADPETDLQTIIDRASPGTRIIGDLNNRRTTGQIEITKNGITLERFHLKLSDPNEHALIAVHGCRNVTIKNARLE